MIIDNNNKRPCTVSNSFISSSSQQTQFHYYTDAKQTSLVRFQTMIMDHQASRPWWSGVGNNNNTMMADATSAALMLNEYVYIYISCIYFSYNHSLTFVCLFVCFAPQQSSININKTVNTSSIKTIANTSFARSATGTPQQQQKLQLECDPTMARTIAIVTRRRTGNKPLSSTMSTRPLSTSFSPWHPSLQVQPEHQSSSSSNNQNAIRQWQWQSRHTDSNNTSAERVQLQSQQWQSQNTTSTSAWDCGSTWTYERMKRGEVHAGNTERGNTCGWYGEGKDVWRTRTWSNNGEGKDVRMEREEEHAVLTMVLIEDVCWQWSW